MKKRKVFSALLLASIIVSMVFLSVTGCNGCKKKDPPSPGYESGVYVALGTEHSITLHSGDMFTLALVNEPVKSGYYSLDDSNLTLKFDRTDDADITARLDDEVITMDYLNLTIRFLKQVMRTVSFESNQGSAVSSVSVMNGKTIPTNLRPANPTRDGYVFVNWYKNAECTDAFKFGEDVITKPTTLYAYWAETVVGQSEFALSFDWNYSGAPQDIGDIHTIGGKLYTFPTQISRSEYSFRGWWVSMPGESGKLSYPVVLGSTTFEESATLFALWQKNTDGIAAPIAGVFSDLISWPAVSGATSYRINITSPDGINVVNNVSVPATTTSYTYAFLQAGDYIIKVAAVGLSETSEDTVRYFRNKALARVSLFSVANSSALIFNQVKNAAKYLVSVDCGNSLHRHNDIDLGTSNVIDFSACEMREGGIQFKVKAIAEGWASSEGIYILNRQLPAITKINIDSDAQIAYWTAIPDATNYIVSVKQGSDIRVENLDNGSLTSYCFKGLNKGDFQISVCPETVGYNSPKITTWISFNKDTLATPDGITLKGNTVKWNSVTNATSYTIKIGNLEITTPSAATEYNLDSTEIAALKSLGDDGYELSVRANGSSPSLFCDPVAVTNYMPESLSYYRGAAEWAYVLGASKYEITVNPDTEWQSVYTAENGENSLKIALTKAQINRITLTALDLNGQPLMFDKAILDVYAYTVTFDTLATALQQPQRLFKAAGDPVDDFPGITTVRAGHNFDTWYTSPGGPINGAGRFVRQPSDLHITRIFTGGDIALYANWSAHTYKIGLDAVEGTINNALTDITFNSIGVLEIPSVNGNGFLGWFTAADAQGTRITDERGIMLDEWSYYWDTENQASMTLYAGYADVLTFHRKGDGFLATRGSDVYMVNHIVIPDTYTDESGYTGKVTDIGMLAHSDLHSLTFGKNVAEYEEIIFDGCLNLENIYVSEGNTEYRDINGVLYNRTGDTLLRYPIGRRGRILFPSNAVTIGEMAFRNYTNLTEITIPASIKNIEANAFKGCVNLVKITLNKGLNEIRDLAFAGANALTQITIPADVTMLGSYAFEECTALTTVTFAGGSTKPLTMGDEVFAGAYRLSSVIFEDGSLVENIGLQAFMGNSMLTEIVIPASVKKIHSSAFQYTTALEKVIIEADSQLELIGISVFDSATSLKEITFKGKSKLTELPDDIFRNITTLERITLPADLINVQAFAFEGCVNLETLIFKESPAFTTIGDNAFSGCEKLTSITLPATATNVTASMFLDCPLLAEILLTTDSSPALSLRAGILYNAARTKLILIPPGKTDIAKTFEIIASVTSIDSRAFASIPNIEAFSVDSSNTAFTAPDGILFGGGGTELIRYPSAKPDTEFNIPSKVATISDYAFKDAVHLVDINFTGENLTRIGAYAFSGCIALSSITIPASVTSVGAFAFNGVSFDSLTIAHGTTRIADYAFANMSGVKGIIIPTTVMEIGDSAFKDSGLETVTFAQGVSQLTSIGNSAFKGNSLTGFTFVDGLKTIGDYAFQNNTSADFSDVIIPAGVTRLGNYAFEGNNHKNVVFKGTATDPLVMGTYVFANNRTLESITFEEGSKVENIGNYAFYNCGGEDISDAKFNSIVIPASVKSIGDYAFSGIGGSTAGANWSSPYYYGLNSVTFEAPNNSQLISIGNFAFQGVAIKEIDLPDSVISIGDSAFHGGIDYDGNIIRGALNRIGFGSGLESIGSRAFYNTSLIVLNNLPQKLKTIGSEAFCNCSGISTDLIIPASVETIGYAAFSQVYGIENPNFSSTDYARLIFAENGSNLKTIETQAFADCGKIGGDLIIPEGVSFIGDNAFNTSMSGLLKLPGSLTSLNSGMFGEYSGTYFTSIEFGEGTTVIPDNFMSGNRLIDINIPASVTTIGIGAFRPSDYYIPGFTPWLTNIETLSFAVGSKLTKVGSYAFGDSTGPSKIVNLPVGIEISQISTVFGKSVNRFELTADYINSPDAIYTVSEDGVLFDITGKTLVAFPVGIGGEYTVKNKNAAVEISVETIGAYAFSGSSLASIVISDSVLRIDNNAFQNCLSLDTVMLDLTNSRLNTIGARAFLNCKNLRTMSIPDGLIDILDGAFAECPNISYIRMSDPHSNFSVKSGWLMKANNLILVLAGTEEVTIPYSMTKIPDYAFYNQTNLKIVNIHADVTHIGDFAFANVGLQQVNFIGTESNPDAPSKLTYIGNHAFSHDPNTSPWGWDKSTAALESIVIPASVTTIGNAAFYVNGSGALTDVIFEEGSRLTTIGESAFSTRVTNANTGEYLPTRFGIGSDQSCLVDGKNYLPDRLTTIGNGAFSGSGMSGELYIPATVQHIGTDAFVSLKNLTNITFADNSRLRVIGMTAFAGSGLEKIDFGKNSLLQTISAEAFQGATGLTSITLPDQLTVIGYGAFWESGLKEYIVSPNSLNFATHNGVLLNRAKNKLMLYPASRPGEYGGGSTYRVPDSVITIATGAFSSHVASSYDNRSASINNVVLHNGVTTIESQAFRMNWTVNIPVSVRTIGAYAFTSGDSETIINVQGRLESQKPVGWGGDTEPWHEPYNTIRWNQPLDLIKFVSVDFYVVEVDGKQNGKLAIGNVLEGPVLSTIGSTVEFTALPEGPYSVKEWTVNGEVVLDYKDNTLAVYDIGENTVVTVEYEYDATKFQVNFDVVGDGTVTAHYYYIGYEEISNGLYCKHAAEWGEFIPVVFRSVPAEGYRVKEWRSNGVVVTNQDKSDYKWALSTWDFENDTFKFTPIAYPGEMNITVEFEPIPKHTVSFSVTGGNGYISALIPAIDSWGVDTEVNSGDLIVGGNKIRFTAYPEDGYRVKQWTLNGVAVANNKTTTYTHSNLSAAITVRVEFEVIPKFVVAYSVVGDNGTLQANLTSASGDIIDSDNLVNDGVRVVFTAAPAEGYRVKEWTLNDATVANNKTNTYRHDNLSADITVRVEFELIPKFEVTYSVVGDNGTLQANLTSASGDLIDSGSQENDGVKIVFTAVPNANYRVKQWKLGDEVVADNTTNTYTHTALSGDITVTVEFELKPIEIIYSVTDGNGTLKANLTNANGAEIPSPGYENNNANILFTATPDTDYRVKQWSVNGTVVANNKKDTYTHSKLSEAITVTVEFEAIPKFEVTYSVEGSEGTLKANRTNIDGAAIASGSHENEGLTLVFTATPSVGYLVKEWRVNGTVVTSNLTNNNNTLTHRNFSNAINVTVEFMQASIIVNYSVIKVNGEDNGTIRANLSSGFLITDGGGLYDNLSTVTFTVTPDNDCMVKEFKVNGIVVTLYGTVYSVENVRDSLTVTVEFEKIKSHPIYFAVMGGNGTVTATVSIGIDNNIGEPAAIESGYLVRPNDRHSTGSGLQTDTVLEFTAHPAPGYRVKEWRVNGILVKIDEYNPISDTLISHVQGTNEAYILTGPVYVTVEFELIPLRILTYSVLGANGTLTATADGFAVDASPAEVLYGCNIEFTATPANGYSVKAWRVNGTVIADFTDTTFVYTNIVSALEVTVEFAVDSASAGSAVIDNLNTVNALSKQVTDVGCMVFALNPVIDYCLIKPIWFLK